MGEKEQIPTTAKEELEMWNEAYSYENLKYWSLEDLESKLLLFENKVERLKAEYRRGRLVTPEMAEAVGKEPLTKEELRDVRKRIENEAEKIRTNFRRAIGEKEKEKSRRKVNYIDSIKEVIDSATDLILSFIMLLQKLTGK